MESHKLKFIITIFALISTISACSKHSVQEGKDYELLGDIRRERVHKDSDEYDVYTDVKVFEEKGKAILGVIAEKICFESRTRWVAVNSHTVRFHLEGYKEEFYAVYKLDKNCNISE